MLHLVIFQVYSHIKLYYIKCLFIMFKLFVNIIILTLLLTIIIIIIISIMLLFLLKIDQIKKYKYNKNIKLHQRNCFPRTLSQCDGNFK